MHVADAERVAVCLAVEVTIALAAEVTDTFTVALALGVDLGLAVAECVPITDMPQPITLPQSFAVEVTVGLAEPLAVGL